jgi:hypothetical protein
MCSVSNARPERLAHYPLGSDNSGRVVGVNAALFINISMTKQDEKQIFEAFKKFSDLYRCKIELTGTKLQLVNEFDLSARPSETISYREVDEVAIKMPKDEYERFLQNWYQYLDLMYVSKYNQMVNEELNKIHMLVQLLK